MEECGKVLEYFMFLAVFLVNFSAKCQQMYHTARCIFLFFFLLNKTILDVITYINPYILCNKST